MSKRKWRRVQRTGGGQPTAHARAQAAIRAGNVQEAERWARLAERLAKAHAPAAQEEEEDHETAMRRIAAKLADFQRGEEEREEVARAYDRLWWEARWNEFRADAGLEPLPLTPLLDPSYIRWAQAHPKVDFLKRTLRRYRARGWLPPAEGEEDDVTEG